MKADSDDAPGASTTNKEPRPRGGGSADRSKGWDDGGTFGAPGDEKDEPKRAESPADKT